MSKRRFDWSLESIRRDQARFEKAHPEPGPSGDPWPAGLTPEQIGATVMPGDWDSYEPNTYGGD